MMLEKVTAMALQLAPSLRHHNASLQQLCAQLIDQRRALAHQPIRTRCRLCMSSCASLLNSTNRIVGRVAASAGTVNLMVTSETTARTA
jgi:hypothetical protein